MAIKICRDCKKEFEYQKSSTRYPRKYCDKCAKARKKSYENIHNICASECEED
jgi:hypothetical protein